MKKGIKEVYKGTWQRKTEREGKKVSGRRGVSEWKKGEEKEWCNGGGA